MGNGHVRYHCSIKRSVTIPQDTKTQIMLNDYDVGVCRIVPNFIHGTRFFVTVDVSGAGCCDVVSEMCMNV